MAHALVAVDLDLAANVSVDFTTQIAFDLIVRLEVVTQRDQLLIRQVLDAGVWIDASRLKGFLGAGASHTEDIGERDLDALVIWDVDSGKTCHCDSFCLPQVSHPIPRYPYRPGPAFPGFSSRIHANCD